MTVVAHSALPAAEPARISVDQFVRCISKQHDIWKYLPTLIRICSDVRRFRRATPELAQAHARPRRIRCAWAVSKIDAKRNVMLRFQGSLLPS
ncbi:MAG TPA: hypothetical protein VL051_13220 [Burkholderiaceae bacterium]|nr:hypothetical protein [Burkholderiaceae bacterium]